MHWTSNETVHGVQYLDAVRFGDAPQVCDASSDILWRKTDVGQLALLYAGAQKNIGPSGLVIVIAARDFVERGRKDLPSILQYRSYVEARSLLNTPPTFAIYLMRNVLSWLKGIGGLSAIEKRNRAKAAVLYAAIDAAPQLYKCPVELESRSVMNVVFRLPQRGSREEIPRGDPARGHGRTERPSERRRPQGFAIQRGRAGVGRLAGGSDELILRSSWSSRAVSRASRLEPATSSSRPCPEG